MPKLSGKSREDRIPDPELRRITQRRADGVDRLIALGIYADRNAVAKAIDTTTSSLWHILNEGRKHSAPALRLDALIDRELPVAARETPIGYNQSGTSDDTFSAFRQQLHAAERTSLDDLSPPQKIVILRKRMEALLTELDAIDELHKARKE